MTRHINGRHWPLCSLSDRKHCPWWVRNSPYSSRPTPPPQPCTWRPRWRRPARSARPPRPVPSPPSRSGWGQWHKILGKEANTSMEPGESGQARAAGGHRFPDYLTVALSWSMSTFLGFPDPKNINLTKCSHVSLVVYHHWKFCCRFTLNLKDYILSMVESN